MLKSAVMSAVNGLKVGISSVNEGDAKLFIHFWQYMVKKKKIYFVLMFCHAQISPIIINFWQVKWSWSLLLFLLFSSVYSGSEQAKWGLLLGLPCSYGFAALLG